MLRPLLAASVLIPLLHACAPSAMPAGTQRQPMVATELADRKLIELAVGEVLSVELPATAGTGFSWAPSSGVGTVLVQTEPKLGFSPAGPSTSERRVGAAEIQVLRFQAQTQGTADLVVDYRRPWETSTPPAQRFQLKVLVR